MSKVIDKQILASIGKYILEGMSESEACILADAKLEDLSTLKEKNENIREFIEKSKVKFKYAHLQEMQTKKSEKISMWLLERLRPEDFATGRSKTSTTINVIGTIIQQIQQDDKEQLIARNRGDRHPTIHQPIEDGQSGIGLLKVLD